MSTWRMPPPARWSSPAASIFAATPTSPGGGGSTICCTTICCGILDLSTAQVSPAEPSILGRAVDCCAVLARSQGDQRIEHDPVDFQALVECALASAKCPLGRN